MHKTILDRENWNLNPGLIYNLSDLEQFFYSFEFIICKMEVMKQHVWKCLAYIVNV